MDGSASKELIDTIVTEPEASSIAFVLTKLKQLHQDFQPTYRSVENYDVFVKEHIANLKSQQTGH